MHRAADEEKLPRAALLETKRLAKALVSYIAAHHDELPAMFDLLHAFTLRTAADLTFLREFFSTTVAQTFTLPEKQAVCCRARVRLASAAGSSAMVWLGHLEYCAGASKCHR